MALLMALDQGTTSSRAIVFADSGEIVAIAQREFQQHYPQSGWVEHDAEEIWTSQSDVAREALAKAKAKAADIAAIGITNQRETVVIWDRATGAPIHHAIVWQDRRTANECDRLRADGREPMIHAKTGLLLDPYFSATKIAWILKHVPGARTAAESGKLACGTVDSWLIYRLTRGKVHVTDASNASRTLLMNIHGGAWDDELLSCFNVPRAMLPEIRSSSEIYGEVDSLSELNGRPIAGIAGDQQAALFGQACFHSGRAKNTYGTGCFMLMNTGAQAVDSKNRLLTTVAWKIGANLEYALEGGVFVGGAVVSWLRDGLGIIKSSADVGRLAMSVADSGGVYFVPAFVGLGAPHWDPYARGTIVGITRGTTAAHIARAAVESIALQVADLSDAMRHDAGSSLHDLRVDGGASVNDGLLQYQADIMQLPVVRPQVTETTALGAAYLAGLAVGTWKTRDEIAGHWKVDRRFEPKMSADEAASIRARWADAVVRSRGWAKAE
ncbi:MAG TPA: glycerol kinase GlpK, partial [Lacipirellulaceae bacterium]|nr:glycerol kinase GlpK [Lacipirellulaceae bacterium]